jgi:hypothetical protein
VRREVMEAANVLHNLADRIGHVPVEGDVPRAVLRQRWSALNVPLMWAAAGARPDCPALCYLRSVAALVPNTVDVAGAVETAANAFCA